MSPPTRGRTDVGQSPTRWFSHDAKIESTRANVVAALLAGDKAIADVVVTIPAEKLDCRNGTMNEHMRKALEVDKHPTIVFRVGSYELAKAADIVSVTMNGSLTLGGVERPITVNAEARPGENGTLLVSGTREVRMTEFWLAEPRTDEGR